MEQQILDFARKTGCMRALLLILLCLVPLTAQAQAAPTSTQSAVSETTRPPAYTLPPAKLAKAEALDRDHNLMWAASSLWSVLSLLLILQLRWVARLRDWAAARTHRPWLQGFLFLPLILLLITLLDLPLSLMGHHISLEYGLSVERWRPWFWDWTKGLLLSLAGGTVSLAILFAIVRHARRLWWLWFWLGSLPFIVGTVYIVPLVIDPLFNHFAPLEQSHPALVAQLEDVVAKSGMKIPPSRMFLMKASEKVTGLNAYVTGFGSSKRVVVWDTTIAKATPDEILYIFGHELGHYVLGHILQGIFVAAIVSLIFLWLGYHAVHWLVRRYGAVWRVPSVEDWAAVPLLLLAFAVFSLLSEPIENAVSRHFEHQADIYGQEIVHGIVPDPQLTGQHSFQTLGEESLDVPDPNPFMVFWTYSHPSIAARAAFARDYNPWAPGHHPRYFPITQP